MNDPLDQRMRELGWREQLTPAEEAELQAFLAARPEAREDWELEARLTRLLEKTPDAPAVASNFTALVMQAVEREATGRTRTPAVGGRGWWWLRNWLPRVATVCLVAGIGLFALHQQQLNERALMAQQVARMAEAVSTLGREPVEHFNPISRLGDAPAEADTDLSELVAALQ